MNQARSSDRPDSIPIPQKAISYQSDLAPNESMEYFVGEYHLHATLRNQSDINNAQQYPTGPSAADIAGANASIAPSGAPGLLRDRHKDEIVQTGQTDYTYGPTRRASPNSP